MTVLLIVTLASMAIALVMSIVAWRVARDERERSDVRVAALAAEIHGAAAPVAQNIAQAAGGRRSEPVRLRAVPAVPQSADMFSAPSPTSSRPAIVIGVGLLLLATAAALVVVLGLNRRADGTETVGRPAAAAVARPASAAGTTAGAPLELVALGHNRDGDRLAVRGVIRNPANGVRVDALTAVVFLFDRDGGFLGSGRGLIESATLLPGGDSTFVVNVPGASDVARYRVSFRTETGIVAHVDNRSKP